MTLTQTDHSMVQEIISHISNRGGSPGDWYVGIASNPRDRLFSDHGVREKGDAWIYRTFGSEQMARAIEQHLLNHLGTDGGPSGGDANTKAVYAYRKGSHTRE